MANSALSGAEVKQSADKLEATIRAKEHEYAELLRNAIDPQYRERAPLARGRSRHPPAYLFISNRYSLRVEINSEWPRGRERAL